VFQLKKATENRGFAAFFITAVWCMSCIPLGILGVGSDLDPSIPELLYIGIPISFFIYLCCLTLCYKHLCYTGGLFRQDNKYWKTWPIAFWAIKCSLEAIFAGLVITFGTLPVLLSIVPSIVLKVIRTLGVVFTKPDGLALDKIQEIWGSKD
jgi:hypothetical protein